MIAIEAGVVVQAAGAATVTVDLRKNGTTILSGVITLNNTHVAYAEVAGTISSARYVTGDVFEIVLTATAGGGTLPQGVYVNTIFREGSGAGSRLLWITFASGGRPCTASRSSPPRGRRLSPRPSSGRGYVSTMKPRTRTSPR